MDTPCRASTSKRFLHALERDKDALLKLGMDVVGPSGSPMYPFGLDGVSPPLSEV